MNRRPLVRRARCRLFALQFEAIERRLLLTTFVVTSTADSGPGTLRQAILDVDADSTPGDTIDFSIGSGGVQIISPLSALPDITNSVTINGTSQPGYPGHPIIVIFGAKAGLNANGLTISAGSSTVQGLDILGFFGNGIDLNSKGDDVIDSCIIGTDYQDIADLGNAGNGVEISESLSNTIGGTTPGAGNVISANSGDGVLITYSGDNLVEGNYIGTDTTGTNHLPNAGNGVEIGGRDDNTIGDTTPGARNVISGNFGDGVQILLSQANLVQGNYIGTNAAGGTNASGTQAPVNSGDGVEISGSVANTIGGTTPGAGNVISANVLAGLLIQGSFSSDNLVQGNYIGTNAAGTEALGNIQGGI